MQTQHAVANAQAAGALSRGRSTGPLDAYSAAIRRYDLLERGQEQQLARRWQEKRDRSATDVLVTSHLRLAARVARGYQRCGLPLSDLIAEANLGLVLAASRFKPDHGSRFSTYALWWIKATIHEYILRSRSLVKIGTTAAQKKLFFKLRTEMRRLTGGERTRLTPEVAEAIAMKLDVTARDVVEMDCRLNGDLSLNRRVGDEERGAEWETMLVDASPDAETILAEQDQTEHRRSALRVALDVLTERERRVFEARRLAEHPLTLDQLGSELAISSERVRQIESRAFAKVQRAVILAARDGGRLSRTEPARVVDLAQSAPESRTGNAHRSSRGRGKVMTSKRLAAPDDRVSEFVFS